MPKRPNKGRLPRPNKGRPPHVPTPKDRQTVELLTGFGLTQDKIAQVVGIERTTLWKHYQREIERGSATVEAKLTANLLRIAGGKDGTAMRAIAFALQCRFGWRAQTDTMFDPNTIPIGKKEAAQIAAQTAGEATDWGEDLQTPATRPN
jgi:DNA-binding XRE family transcriptional regulator